jgi:hypothetical protein
MPSKNEMQIGSGQNIDRRQFLNLALKASKVIPPTIIGYYFGSFKAENNEIQPPSDWKSYLDGSVLAIYIPPEKSDDLHMYGIYVIPEAEGKYAFSFISGGEATTVELPRNYIQQIVSYVKYVRVARVDHNRPEKGYSFLLGNPPPEIEMPSGPQTRLNNLTG